MPSQSDNNPVGWTTHCMRRALTVARRGQGVVEPNPMVGAVLVRDGQIVTSGYHRRYGAPHAEVDALERCRQVGQNPAGCDLYVTLEPCCHHGKTPPCTEAIIAAGVHRVIVAMPDPSPRVRGRGIDLLRAAGILVELGPGRLSARRLNEPYIKRVRTGMPWVILKWAQTLDGHIATRTGDSRWISNDTSRRFVHRLRARVDGVLVGIGTVLADDPILTARHTRLRRCARRVIVDPDLQIPMDSRLIRSLRSEKPAPPITMAVRESVLAGSAQQVNELRKMGVEIIGLPTQETRPSRLDLEPLLRHLCNRYQATNVLVEGGSKLSGALIEQGLADQVLAFVAPKLLGDSEAVSAVQGLTCQGINEARRLRLREMRRIGHDILLDYRISR